MAKGRILFVNQEITPFSGESEIAAMGRYLPARTQEMGREIRVFMPKFSNVAERKHQLHEVIRLSGMNLIMNNCDRQLYLGGQDLETATYISRRSDKPLHTIMTMPFDSAYLIIRGELPRLSKRYHLPEASPLSSSPSNPAPHKNTPAAGF